MIYWRSPQLRVIHLARAQIYSRPRDHRAGVLGFDMLAHCRGQLGLVVVGEINGGVWRKRRLGGGGGEKGSGEPRSVSRIVPGGGGGGG